MSGPNQRSDPEYEAFKRNNERIRRESTSSLEDLPKSQFSDSNLTLFKTLLTDPSKRKKVLELLTNEGIVSRENIHSRGARRKNIGNQKGKIGTKNFSSPVNNIPRKFQFESPSALHRRRALQKLEANHSDVGGDSTDSSQSTEAFHGTPVEFDKLLDGVTAFVEVRSGNDDRSEVIKTMMKAMGAEVKDAISRGVTHVVFKDGHFTTFERAKLVKAHLVSVLWLEATKRNRFRVPEKKYPALGVTAYDYNVTTLCEDLQKDYDKIIKDEKKRRSDIHCSRRNSEFVTKRRTMHVNESFLDRNKKDDSIYAEMERIHKGNTSLIETTLATSDCESSDSILSISSDIIPSSQKDTPRILKNTLSQHPTIMELTEDESIENESLAVQIKDSFELKKALNIRSPESLMKNKSLDISDKTNKKATDEDSLHLHITTDESNVTGSKIRRSSSSVTKSLDFSNHNKILTKSSDEIPFKEPKNTRKKNYSSDKTEDTNLITNYFDSKCSEHDNLPKTKRNTRKTLFNIDLSKDNDPDELNPIKSDAKLKTIVKKRTRKTICNSEISLITNKNITENSLLDKENDENKIDDNILKENTMNNQNVNNGSNTIQKNKRRLYNPNQSFDDTAIIWEKKLISSLEVPHFPKIKTKYDVEMPPGLKTNKILTKKALNYIKKNTTSSSDEKISPDKKLIKTPEKNTEIKKIQDRRKSTRLIKGTENDTENSSPKKRTNTVNIEIDSPKKKTKTMDKNIEAVTPKKGTNTDLDSLMKKSKTINKNIEPVTPKKGINRDLDSLMKKSKTINKNIEPVTPKKGINRDLDSLMKKSKTINKNIEPVTPKKGINRDLDSPIKKSKTVIKNIVGVTPKKGMNTDLNSPKTINKNVENDSTPTVSQRRKSLRNLPKKNNDKDINFAGKTPKKTIQNQNLKSPISSSQITTRKTPKKPDLKTPIQSRTNQKSPKNLLTYKSPKSLQSKILENVAERRSTLDFVQKSSKKSPEIKLTQKSMLKLCGITCTRLHRPDVLLFEEIVKQIGGFVVEDEVSEITTHLVVGQPSRTINMLRAIARGCWILKHEWLYKSLEAGKWLQEEDYEVTDFSNAVQKCRMERQVFGPLYSMDIFKNCGNIYICRSSTPRCTDLEDLVSLCGGTTVKNPRQAQIIVGESFRYENVICVNEKWILECITHNKKKSFKNFILKRNSVSSSS